MNALECAVEACKSGNVCALRQALATGFSRGVEHDSVALLLHTATRFNQRDVLTFLLGEAVIDVDARGTKGDANTTALLIAVHSYQRRQAGNMELIEFLLDHGADPNVRSHDHYLPNQTPLMMAIEASDEELVWLLLKHGADPNALDRRQDTCVSLLVRALDFDFSEPSTAIAQMLLQHGANPNFRVSEDEFEAMPLHTAVQYAWDDNDPRLRLLLDHEYPIKTDLDVTNGRGQTALHLAARSGKNDIVNLLLQRGADVNALNKNGDPALCVVSGAENSDPVRTASLLLHYGANVNLFGTVSPLHNAINAGNAELVKLLLEHGAIQYNPLLALPQAIMFPSIVPVKSCASKPLKRVKPLKLKHGPVTEKRVTRSMTDPIQK